jgi:restriction endonuclease S subunit
MAVGYQMTLDQIASIRIGFPLVRSKTNPYEEGAIKYKVLTLRSFTNEINPSLEYLDDFFSIKQINSQYLTQLGDIIIRLRTPSNAILINDKQYVGLVVPSVMSVIRIKDFNLVDSEFLVNYLNSKIIQNTLNKDAKGSSIQMIPNSALLNLNIILPSLEEQQGVVRYIKLANEEVHILQKIIVEKTKLKNEIFQTIIINNQGA